MFLTERNVNAFEELKSQINKTVGLDPITSCVLTMNIASSLKELKEFCSNGLFHDKLVLMVSEPRACHFQTGTFLTGCHHLLLLFNFMKHNFSSH